MSDESKKGVSIYHQVFAHEGLETTATILVQLIQQAQQQRPDAARFLYLDIDGHKNSAGGFDDSMFRLQQNFILEFLAPYLSEIHIPIIAVKLTQPQLNDLSGLVVPEEFRPKKRAIDRWRSKKKR